MNTALGTTGSQFGLHGAMASQYHSPACWEWRGGGSEEMAVHTVLHLVFWVGGSDQITSVHAVVNQGLLANAYRNVLQTPQRVIICRPCLSVSCVNQTFPQHCGFIHWLLWSLQSLQMIIALWYYYRFMARVCDSAIKPCCVFNALEEKALAENVAAEAECSLFWCWKYVSWAWIQTCFSASDIDFEEGQQVLGQ